MTALGARLLLAAGLFAGAELALALTIGGFFALGRAEALVFLAFRPWLLLVMAVSLARRAGRERALTYGVALTMAATGETLFLLALGADQPWAEAGQGLVAGGLLALALDLLVQAGRRLGGRLGAFGGPLLGGMLLLVPGGLFLYDRLLLEPAGTVSGRRPALMLITGLPIIWGEGGAFDPNARPSESYRLLEREFRLNPLDSLTDETLSGRLLLLAQPRALAPEELVALDAWVRRGGRALFLLDPALDWPSELPLGDVRRPPPLNMLGPLLDHWGVRLEPPLRDDREGAPLYAFNALPEPGWRLAVTSPGQFEAPGCRMMMLRHAVRCRIGAGEVLLVGDADLLRDDLWAPYGPTRHQRVADNPLIVAAWLDQLAGIRRERVDGRAAWIVPEPTQAKAIAIGALPAGAALLLAGGLARGRRAGGGRIPGK
jgi:hypothetical protein